jgi:hypothetical protein
MLQNHSLQTHAQCIGAHRHVNRTSPVHAALQHPAPTQHSSGSVIVIHVRSVMQEGVIAAAVYNSDDDACNSGSTAA